MATSCDPAALVRAAKCFPCIPRGSRRWVRTYLLCQLANSGQMMVPTATALVANTQSSTLIRLKWDVVPAGVTSTKVYTSTDGVNFFPVTTVNAPLNVTTIAAGAVVGQIQYIKIQWCIGSICGPFSNVARIPGSVADWASRVLANGGGAPSVNTLTYLDIFWLSLNDNGLVSQMISLNVFAPDNLTAALTPFIKTSGNDPWTNNAGNFLNGDLTINGLQGDGATKILLTGLLPQTIWQNTGGNVNASTSAGVSIYTVTVGASAFVDVGSQSDFASGQLSLDAVFQPGGANQSSAQFFNNSSAAVTVVNAGWTGFTSGSRTSPTSLVLYTASSSKAFGALGTQAANSDGNAMPSREICVFGYRNNAAGTLVPNSDRRMSFAAIHLGLSSTDTQNLYNAVQTFRSNIGGGFV